MSFLAYFYGRLQKPSGLRRLDIPLLMLLPKAVMTMVKRISCLFHILYYRNNADGHHHPKRFINTAFHAFFFGSLLSASPTLLFLSVVHPLPSVACDEC